MDLAVKLGIVVNLWYSIRDSSEGTLGINGWDYFWRANFDRNTCTGDDIDRNASASRMDYRTPVTPASDAPAVVYGCVSIPCSFQTSWLDPHSSVTVRIFTFCSVLFHVFLYITIFLFYLWNKLHVAKNYATEFLWLLYMVCWYMLRIYFIIFLRSISKLRCIVFSKSSITFLELLIYNL